MTSHGRCGKWAGSSHQVTNRLDALATWIETLRDSVAAHRGLVAAIESTVPSAPASLATNIEALVIRIKSGTPLDRAFAALARRFDYGTDTTVMDWEYLLLTARNRS
jgi:hypothetical protein